MTKILRSMKYSKRYDVVCQLALVESKGLRLKPVCRSVLLPRIPKVQFLPFGVRSIVFIKFAVQKKHSLLFQEFLDWLS